MKSVDRSGLYSLPDSKSRQSCVKTIATPEMTNFNISEYVTRGSTGLLSLTATFAIKSFGLAGELLVDVSDIAADSGGVNGVSKGLGSYSPVGIASSLGGVG